MAAKSLGLKYTVEMRAILLAGGKGTRLRPLTLHTPKPIVPIFDRPFLRYQIDLLRQVPEIDEIVLSLNYQPRRIEEVFGWIKTQAGLAKVKVRSRPEAEAAFTFAAAAYNLVRLPKLLAAAA